MSPTVNVSRKGSPNLVAAKHPPCVLPTINRTFTYRSSLQLSPLSSLKQNSYPRHLLQGYILGSRHLCSISGSQLGSGTPLDSSQAQLSVWLCNFYSCYLKPVTDVPGPCEIWSLNPCCLSHLLNALSLTCVETFWTFYTFLSLIFYHFASNFFHFICIAWCCYYIPALIRRAVTQLSAIHLVKFPIGMQNTLFCPIGSQMCQETDVLGLLSSHLQAWADSSGNRCVVYNYYQCLPLC